MAGPSLPSVLSTHIAACLELGLEGFWLAELRQRPVEAAARLMALVERASRLTRLPPAEMLASTGLAAADLRGHRLDDALAELSAVCYLHAEGFTDIRALPGRSERGADLLARQGGLLYAFDVRCASRRLEPSGGFEGKDLPFPTLSTYAAMLAREKRPQLEATIAAHGCDRGGILVGVRLTTGLPPRHRISDPSGLHIAVFDAAALPQAGIDD